MSVRTTNPAEGFHSGSKERFVASKSHLLRFIKMLMGQRDQTRVKYDQFVTGTVQRKTPKKTWKRYWAIKEAVKKFGEVEPIDYLEGLASNIYIANGDDGRTG